MIAQADVALVHGELDTARALREDAAAVISYLADHAGTPDLRASFLNQQHVRRALALM